jgi:enoyl-CoA hydratase
VAMEIMRCAIAPQFFVEAILSGATYTPLEAVARGFIHEIIEPQALLERAVAAATSLAALPPTAFALSKRQIHAPALERMQRPDLDAAIEQIWTAPETLERVRDYVARTLRKS